MDQPQITFNGRSYEAEISHERLNKYEIVRGRYDFEVAEKAKAKLAQWDEMWKKRQGAEHARSQREKKKETAAQRTADAKATVLGLKRVLADALARNARIDWEMVKDDAPFSKPKPVIPEPAPPVTSEAPSAPERADPKYQPRFGLLDYLSPERKEAKRQTSCRLFERDYELWAEQKRQWEQQLANMRSEHQREIADWQARQQQADGEWLSEREQFVKRQAAGNAQVDALREGYDSCEAEAIAAYCRLVLTRSQYPPTLPKPVFRLDYTQETKTVVVEYTLPSPDHMPRLKEVRYVQARDSMEELALADSVVNGLYDEVVYLVALRTLHELYEADTIEAIDSVVFNGWVTAVDKSTGQEVSSCILSVQAGRAEFSAINLGQVDPKECFRKLRGVGSSKLHGLAPIAPILQLSRDDKRFIQAREVADKLSEGDNLASMDWEDFEHLVRELFEKEFVQSGGEVKVTQASRDRGVDAVAFDPDPIRGGKIVIQAKRYTNVVDVSAVRDLYGTVVNEGATKGILVTTSEYGPEAYEFAKGKPLTLLNGGNLLSLLEKHGHKARIDLEEARRLQAQ